MAEARWEKETCRKLSCQVLISFRRATNGRAIVGGPAMGGAKRHTRCEARAHAVPTWHDAGLVLGGVLAITVAGEVIRQLRLRYGGAEPSGDSGRRTPAAS